MPSQTFSTPGSFTFKIPTGVFLLDSEEATGAGDGGSSLATDGSGSVSGVGGNWGGSTNVVVVPGDSFSGTIGTGGAGGTPGNPGGTGTATVSLFSGTVGNANNGGGGTFSGGNNAGNDGSGGAGGGGGGGAATSGGVGGDGSQGSGSSGGAGGTANGGNGGDQNNNGSAGGNPGGGGGGAGGDGNGGLVQFNGGKGGDGQVIETWTAPTTVVNLVQRVTNDTTSATTLSKSFTTNPTAGHAMVVTVKGLSLAAVGSQTVTDNQGNTYTQAVFLQDTVLNGEYAGIWYCPNIASSGTFTVTFTFTGTAGIIEMCVEEVVMPVGKILALDQQSSNKATSTAPAPGSVTTTANDEYLAAAMVCKDTNNPATVTTPTNYNSLYKQTNGSTKEVAESVCQQVSASSGFNPTWTIDQTVPWVAVQATFKTVSAVTETFPAYKKTATSFVDTVEDLPYG